MKRCSKCKIYKDKSEFHSSKNKPDGLYNSCKICKRQSVNVWYSNNKEKALSPKRRMASKIRAIQWAKDNSVKAYAKNNKSYLKVASNPKGHLERLLALVKQRCKKTNRPFTLTIDFLINLYNLQFGLCAISGIPMTYIKGQGKIQTNISIDQIIAGAGYTSTDIDLLEWCKAIIKNNEKFL